MLYYENYFMYAEGLQRGRIEVNTKDITKETYNEYYNGIVNIIRDAIETDLVQKSFIVVDFNGKARVELSFFDYLYTLIMWNLLIETGTEIEPKHLFFEENVTGSSFTKYINKFFISPNRKKFDNMFLNNVIDDTLQKFLIVDEFDMFLCNTVNLEDTIDLMNERPHVYDLLHKDFSNIPLEEVKNLGMKYTNEFVEEIKNSDHCLADSFRAKEGTNVKQFKEFAINIGTKPDGQGSVFPAVVNNSYINGGINNLLSYMIDSSTGRTAQILAKRNVADSGHFSRLLRSNNLDTWLNDDPEYKCNTKNLERIVIKDKDVLSKLNNRYYKLSENGMDHLINSETDSDLIGKTILLYSPMTCASKANGKGICYRCYGNLAYTNYDINVGVIAAETLSRPLTQKLLSAKHLLESLIKKITWSEGFNDFFEMVGNAIRLSEDISVRGYKLLIDPEGITLEEEFEDYSYNEYINEFEIQYPDGELKRFFTSENNNLYLSESLNNIIRSKAEPIDGKIVINLSELKDMDIFVILIQNNELSKTLNEINAIINKGSVTKSFDRDTILQALIEAAIKGGLDVDSVHLEVILSNQIRAIDNILEVPEWEYPNEDYEILTLNRALTFNPSPIISLTHEKIGKALYNPITFRKNKPSFLDLFFIEKPSEFISATEVIPAKKKRDPNTIVPGIEFIKDEE